MANAPFHSSTTYPPVAHNQPYRSPLLERLVSPSPLVSPKADASSHTPWNTSDFNRKARLVAVGDQFVSGSYVRGDHLDYISGYSTTDPLHEAGSFQYTPYGLTNAHSPKIRSTEAISTPVLRVPSSSGGHLSEEYGRDNRLSDSITQSMLSNKSGFGDPLTNYSRAGNLAIDARDKPTRQMASGYPTNYGTAARATTREPIAPPTEFVYQRDMLMAQGRMTGANLYPPINGPAGGPWDPLATSLQFNDHLLAPPVDPFHPSGHLIQGPVRFLTRPPSNAITSSPRTSRPAQAASLSNPPASIMTSSSVDTASVCHECGRVISTAKKFADRKSNLKRHQRIEHGDKLKHACPEQGCDRLYKRSDALAKHRRHSHGHR